MTFLAMVMLLFGTDTSIAFATKSKARWFELPVFIEIFGVMLYVMLGILVQGFWHPGWLLCLAGACCALVQVIVVVVKKPRKTTPKRRRNLPI